MPPKLDLVFNTAPAAVEIDHPTFIVPLSPIKPEQDLSHTNRPTSPIIEDWFFDFEYESETNAPHTVPSFVQSSEQVKSPRHSVQHVEPSDKGVIDSGCSRHMTGNMSYLSDFKELNGRYVAFRGNPKGGKFNGKVNEGFLVGYSKPESEVNVSPSSSAQTRKQDDKTKKEAKGKSPVESFTGYRDLSAKFEDCSDNNINE
nr:hypothetical protein [Tanacetum cinerariifolium]